MSLSRRALLSCTAPLLGLAVAGMPLPLLAAGRTSLSGHAFGTSWTVLAQAPRDSQALAGRIAAALGAIDAEMSPFRPDSALSRFNAGGRDVAISAGFEQVVQAALSMAELSGGAYDPGVGPAVRRYGFGPIRGAFTPGLWRAVRCEGQRLTTGPEAGAATLDPCGIAKGFAVDVLAAILAGECDSFIVEIGGEIRASGDWPVGISDPVRGGVHTRIRLSGGAVATSGTAVNGFDHAGRRWSHVIDPATGQPVATQIASVSVLAPTAMQADAMATALMVLGEERGLRLAEAQGLGALFLLREGKGLRASANAAFAAHRV